MGCYQQHVRGGSRGKDKGYCGVEMGFRGGSASLGKWHVCSYVRGILDLLDYAMLQLMGMEMARIQSIFHHRRTIYVPF